MNQEFNNIYLYHGTTSSFKIPNLDNSKSGKDFGKGFYLTRDKSQALKFAKNKGLRDLKNIVYLNKYFLFNFEGLKIYVFNKTDINWFNCVANNRLAKPNKWDKYDILIGKIADDDTILTINAYMYGLYGKVGSTSAINSAIKLLKPEKLKDQICFKTKKSLDAITFVKQERVNI